MSEAKTCKLQKKLESVVYEPVSIQLSVVMCTLDGLEHHTHCIKSYLTCFYRIFVYWVNLPSMFLQYIRLLGETTFHVSTVYSFIG